MVRALDGASAGPIVDLGAGTGAWSAALAAWTGRRVVAVQPSAAMRAGAAGTAAGGLVAGRSGALPLRAGAAIAAGRTGEVVGLDLLTLR